MSGRNPNLGLGESSTTQNIDDLSQLRFDGSPPFMFGTLDDPTSQIPSPRLSDILEDISRSQIPRGVDLNESVWGEDEMWSFPANQEFEPSTFQESLLQPSLGHPSSHHPSSDSGPSHVGPSGSASHPDVNPTDTLPHDIHTGQPLATDILVDYGTHKAKDIWMDPEANVSSYSLLLVTNDNHNFIS